MNIKEIVELENKRQLVSCEIHLFQEGTFLRAYESSAWLSCQFLHELKVTHRAFKNINGTVVFVGFPKTSLEKWLPNPHDMQMVDEKHLVVLLPQIPMPENAEEAFKAWKSEQALAEQPSKDTSISHTSDNRTMTGIMRRILEYPLESKSPIDNMLFISSLKKDIVQFI